MQRKDAILEAACDQFGRFGFRGASLRDIARAAGVSLTLLNHHFGCKKALLSAVIAGNRRMLQERVAVLGRGRDEAVAPSLPDLVRTWVGIGFETAAVPQGLPFLRLLARVVDDPAEDGIEIDCGLLDGVALVFIESVQQCCPGASRQATVSAWLCASASLTKLLLGGERMARLAGVEPAQSRVDQAWLECFLVAGIEAALNRPAVQASAPAEADDAMASHRNESSRELASAES